MKKTEQAVILAGGLGTRLLPFTLTAPKPMYPFNGAPFLEYLLLQVQSFGLKKALLLLGYLPEVIIEYFRRRPIPDLEIIYDITPVEYDTGARLLHARPLLDEHFLLMYCDNYCPLDFSEMQRRYFSQKLPVQLTAYTNRDGYTKSNLSADTAGFVTSYDKTRSQDGLSMVDIGYALVRKDVLDLLEGDNPNFESCVYPKLVRKGGLSVYATEHRYYSVGSFERIKLTEAFFCPKKTAFLDRDGTLNVKPGKAQYITRPEDFIWLKGAREAIHLLKQNGYTLILITNQPGIARGILSAETLRNIHRKMQADLALQNDKIDAIYVCPHGWHDGCFCRKPLPGLLYQAQRDFSLNLSETVLFGDDERDISAGRAAGCGLLMQVTEQFSLYDRVTGLLKEAGGIPHVAPEANPLKLKIAR